MLQGTVTEHELTRQLKGKLGERFSLRTLRRWRARGEGPAWGRAGKFVLYSEQGVAEWLQSLIKKPTRGR